MNSKLFLIFCLVVVLVIAVTVPAYFLLKDRSVLHYTCEVVNSYLHDGYAFTQGLLFEDGVLYESTGRYGNSSLRRVELQTGRILQIHHLPKQFFGEGITIFNEKIIQLTWRENKGFVYNKTSFELLEEFSYSTEEGWGITNDGHRLIMSDGTANLYFLNPETFERTGQIEVRDKTTPVAELNELEYIKGDVYANIWRQEKIAIIDPNSGQVKAWINCTGLRSMMTRSGDVLNGIAYDVDGDRLFITGKLWSQLFEVRLIEIES